jgi:hypothetical protein
MIVEGPNGIRIEFPDGTDNDTVNKVMTQAFNESKSNGDFARQASGMTHEQMVEAYRKTTPGDPWGDFLAQRIQQPMRGETTGEAKTRAYGTGSTDRVDMSGTGKAAATFLQGVPFVGEYADEGLGWLAGKLGLQSEQDATNAIRAGQADMDQNSPKTALGLRLAGGVTGSAVGAGILPWYTPGSLGGQVAYGTGMGSALGGAEGAISGYGSGTDETSRAKNAKSRAIVGALVGGAVGGAAPLAADGIKRAARLGLDRLNVAREAKQAGLSRPSYELMTRAMDADGSLTGQGANRIAAAGPDGMLADAGPNAQALLDVAMQKSGPASNEARNAIEGRATRAGSQVNSALDNALGAPRGMDTMERGIRQGSAAARDNTYRAAYAQPINYSVPEGQTLEAMLPQIPPDVLRTANRIMQVRREPQSAQIIMRENPDGSFSLGSLPDVRQWDYISRAMNEIAAGQEGTGALGGQTAIGSGFQSWARDIRKNLRGLVPEYGTALDTAGDAIANREALRFGERLFAPGTTRDEVATTFASMSQAEKQQAAAGLRSYIDEKLSNVTRALTDSNMDAREAIKAVKDLSSRANREKVTALLGQRQADTLFTEIDQAAQSLELRANLATNTKTFVRTDTDRIVQEATTGGVSGAVRSGQPVNAGRRIVQSLLGGTEADNLARTDRVYSEIARALTGKNPQQTLKNLQRIAKANPRNEAIARLVGNLIGYPIGAPIAYQLGNRMLSGGER